MFSMILRAHVINFFSLLKKKYPEFVIVPYQPLCHDNNKGELPVTHVPQILVMIDRCKTLSMAANSAESTKWSKLLPV